MRYGLLSALIFVFVGSNVFAKQTIKIAAGAAPLDNIFKKVEAAFEKTNPDYDLVFERVDPKVAIEKLDKGEVDGASIAFNMADWLKKAEEDGYNHKPADIYKSRVIGKDLTLIIKNKANTLKSLDKEQIKKIFTGDVKKWSEIGGSGTDVVVVYNKAVPGINKFFKQLLLQGAEFSKNAKVLDVEKEAIDALKKEVAGNPGAVAFIPYGAKDPSVETFATEDIGRPVTFATIGIPSEKVLKLLDFISKNSDLTK